MKRTQPTEKHTGKTTGALLNHRVLLTRGPLRFSQLARCGLGISRFFWLAPLCPNYNVFAMTGPRKLPASLSPCLQAPVQAQPGAMGGSDGDPPEERQGASTKEPAPRARRKRGSRTRRP